jgi:hypothetical protein
MEGEYTTQHKSAEARVHGQFDLFAARKICAQRLDIRVRGGLNIQTVRSPARILRLS